MNIPENLQQKINEFTKGGFLIFYFDQNGTPNLTINVDDNLNFMALHRHAQTWANAFEEAQIQNLANDLSESEDDDEI